MASALLRERLPPGFHIGVTQDGRIFFINDRNQSTSWLHPTTGEPVLTGLSQTQREDLPRGWEEDYTNEGQVFYVDHNRGVTTFTHPFQGELSHQQSQDYPPTSQPQTHQDPSTPPALTNPSSPTQPRDNFKRGTFKQRSVKAPTAKRNPNSEVVKKGWLYRLESGGLSKSKNWKKRWAVLADFALFLYKGDDEASVLSSILLPGYRINPCSQEDNIKKNFVFKVEHENTKSVFLGTEDSPDLLSWMSLLRQASLMNGQTGFQREPNNNYRRYPSKEGGNANDRQQQEQYQKQQHDSHPHHQDPNNPEFPHPHSDYSFRQGGSNYSPSSNPSFQKLPNFRPYNQQESPTDSRVMPPFSQGQSPSYQDYNNDPASSPMEQQPPRVGGVYPFIHQQGQRQSYVSQGSSNRNSYAPPNSTQAQPLSSNERQYSTNPEKDNNYPHFNDNGHENKDYNVNQPKWQDSLEDSNRFGLNNSRNYPPTHPEHENGHYPHTYNQKPLRDGFAPDSVRSSLAQPEQRYSYNDPRLVDQNNSIQNQQQPNPSDFNNRESLQHNYSGAVDNYYPIEPNVDPTNHLNLPLSSSLPKNRLSQGSQDGRQHLHQFQQDASPSSLSLSFSQQRNSFSQNPQHRNLQEQERKSVASTSSAENNYRHQHPQQHQQQQPLHHQYQQQQQHNQHRFDNSFSSPQQQRSMDSTDQIHPSSSSALHSSFSPEFHPSNQSYPNLSQSHISPHQATSSPSSSTHDYNASLNPHTYVNFPNPQQKQQQQQQHAQPPSSLPLQQQHHHLLKQQHNTSRDSSIEPPPPSRPPYPAEMRHHIVEEMAKVSTPSTQKDFLTSAQINQQRMQQPSYFQYPSPRGYTETKKDANLQSSSQNPNNSFRDISNPRFSASSQDDQRDNRAMGTNPREMDNTNGGLNASFSRNMMDPEAKKLRAAYERVQNLRSSPDKSKLYSLDTENDFSLQHISPENSRFSQQQELLSLSSSHRGYKSQDELDGVGKTPPPAGSYHKIRDDSEGLYMRGSAFRPPSSLSESQTGSDSLMRTKKKFHSSTTMSHSPNNYDKREDLRLVGAASHDNLLYGDENGQDDNDGYFNRENRHVSHSNYYNLSVNDFDTYPWRNNEDGERDNETARGIDPYGQKSQRKQEGHGQMDRELYGDEHPFFDPYGNIKEMRRQQQQQQQPDLEKNYQKPILLAAPPRRKPAPIQTVKEDPDMPDRDVLETDLQKIAAKNPLSGPRLRMSISAADLIGKTHDELVLLLIQLRRNQAALDKTRDLYRAQIDQMRSAELEYRRQINQHGNVTDGSLHNAHRNFTDAKTQMEEIENKLEVYRPIINLLDNMVTMGSLYGGDNLMLATQYRKHLLRPDQYQPAKNMLHFTRQNQEDRLIQGTHEDIKQLSKDEVDLEDKIDRLNEVDRAVQEQSFKVSSFKEDKELMEKALVGILRQQDQNRYDPREMHKLTQQQRTLEKEISRVTQQLAEASKELEATTAENNKLEYEIALLRTKVHGELSRSRSAPSLASENIRTKMKMEKELAKVQDMMQGLNQKGAKLSQAMNTLRRSSSGTNIAAALDDPNDFVKASGTYMQTDLDSGEQLDLADSREQTNVVEGYPPINHHRQNAADDWDIDRNDEDTKKFFGLLPRDKPKGQTVRDVKRLSEARKEEKRKDDEFGEEVKLRVSNVDNEVSSIIHARIAKDTQAAVHHPAPSGDQTWDSSSHPLYENLPRYGSMPQLAENKNGGNNSINQSAASSRRSSIILLTPKPFVPYEDKSARSVRSSDFVLNSAFGKLNNTATSSNGFDYKDGGNDNNNNTGNENDYFTKDKNFSLDKPVVDRPYHSQDLNLSGTQSYPDLDSSHQSYNHNEMNLEQNGRFHAKPTTIFPRNATTTTERNIESPITAQFVDRKAESAPGQQSTNQPSWLHAPRPWVRDAAELEVKKTARGRYSTISSSQPVRLESSLLNPTLHSSAGDLILNRSIDDVPDIVKSSQGRGDDQLDGDVIDREILSMPDKVLIPERYDAEADAEHLTENEKMARQERSERIRRVLTKQSVMSLSQPDISQLPSEEIHSRIQQEKKERAYYLALNQELARQVTQQSQKQADTMTKRSAPKDWDKCLVCQQTTTEHLECPASSRKRNKGQGYATFVDNVTKFNALVSDDETLDLSHISSERNEIIETLNGKHAKWHKSCRVRFNSSKIKRLEVKRSKQTEQQGTQSSYSSDLDDAPNNDESMSTPRRSTREPSKIEIDYNRRTCFFCKNVESGPLHSVMTRDMEEKIREIALSIKDVDLLAFIAEGDLVAKEAHYHKLCHTRYSKKVSTSKDIASDDVDVMSPERSLAFAEVVSFIDENPTATHRLSDLIRRYKHECHALGYSEEYVHPSRFKERLLRVTPNLEAYSSGRETVVAFNSNIAALLVKNKFDKADDDAVSLWRTAKVIRQDLAKHSVPESDELNLGNQENSVPKSLLVLVKMLLVGSAVLDNTTCLRQQESLTISQLISSNSIMHKRRESTAQKRQVVKKETPLPLYVSLFLYTNTRSKKIIDTLFSLGLCVSYKRVISLSSDIALAVEKRFEDDGVVCPTDLRNDVFTVAAVDNLDYNPSSTTSKKSFHGTCISVFQQADSEGDGQARGELTLAHTFENEGQATTLSEFLRITKEVSFGIKPSIPAFGHVKNITTDTSNLSRSMKEESEWLDHVSCNYLENNVKTWAGYHSERSQTSNQPRPVSINTILPLLEDQANKIPTIKHAMDHIKRTTTFLNPSQIPVMVADQPLFALGKLIQWKWPEIYGEDKFFVLMGGLHIEMEFLKTMGTLLDGTGWTHVLTKAGICGAGTADSYLKACHLKRTRYAHQVTAAALAILKQDAHTLMTEENSSSLLTFDEWCRDRKAISHQFYFWDLVLKLEMMTLCLIKAFRNGDFTTYVEVLTSFVPFLFGLNKTNYARWLPVHISDLLNIEVNNPTLHQQFCQGYFTIKKSNRPFSLMSIDQAHEQNNQKLKGTINAISLMETPKTLQRWMLAAPHFSKVLSKFETSVPGLAGKESQHHADDTLAKEKKITKDIRKMVAAFESVGNPFKEASGTAIINVETGETANAEIVESIRSVENVGKQKYIEFVESRLTKRTVKITDPMKCNKMKLMSSKTNPASKPKSHIKNLKSDCTLFSQLYIACNRRGGDLDEFFSHENSSHPPSLSTLGYIRTSDNKSELTQCLLTGTCHNSSVPSSTCFIFDGAVMVHLFTPSGIMTFYQYATTMFVPSILSMAKAAERIDVVFDVYDRSSLKLSARTKRGQSGVRRVSPDVITPRNWKEFLRNDENKSSLFRLLAEAAVESIAPEEKTVFATCGSDVLSNSQGIEEISPCSIEEADNRMILHAADAARNGHTNIIIRSVDTDVVVLATSFFFQLNVQHLWIAYGTGQHFKYIPIHEIARSLGPEKTRAVLFFHAFTGCDTVSAFHGIGKKTAWASWTRKPEVTSTFITLSSSPSGISEQDVRILEEFIISMYDKSLTCTGVNDARRILFCQKGRSIERLPPTSGALVQHIKRAAYQAGHVWFSSLEKNIQPPSPLDWGWKMFEDRYEPLWSLFPEVSKVSQKLIKCTCKRECTSSRCKCLRSNLPCTDLCKCGGC